VDLHVRLPVDLDDRVRRTLEEVRLLDLGYDSGAARIANLFSRMHRQQSVLEH
jgi:hypothetical protein